MENNEIIQVLESAILRDSLTLYMNELTRQHKGHPDYLRTMEFVGSLYKKYSRIAGQRVMTDEMGRTVLRKDIRSKFDLN